MGKKVPKSVCIFGANFMLEQVIRLENEINGALDARDIEHIHRMRVASRRLRNAFEHFKDCFPKKTFKKWQDDVRQITKSLGTARDLDIQIERLSGLYNDSMDPSIKPGYQRLLLRLKQRRAKAQEKVNKTLNKMRDEKTLEKIRIGIKKLSLETDNVYIFTPALYQRAFNAINSTLYDFLSYEEFIYSPENVEELHAMRIATPSMEHAKRLLRWQFQVGTPVPFRDLRRRSPRQYTTPGRSPGRSPRGLDIASQGAHLHLVQVAALGRDRLGVATGCRNALDPGHEFVAVRCALVDVGT